MNCRLSKRLVVSAVIALLQQNSVLGQEQLKTQTTQRQENIRTTSHSGLQNSQAIKHDKADKDFSNNMMAAYKTFEVAESLNKQNRFSEAEPFYRKALLVFEKDLGPTSDAQICRDILVKGYCKQHQYSKAEQLLKSNLSRLERESGVNSPNLCGALGTLADYYEQQGKLVEARTLLERSLKICERTFGSEHGSLISNLNRLAMLSEKQRNYAEAERNYKRALAIEIKSSGKTDYLVAYACNNLAALYCKQDRYKEAEPLYKQALSIQETRLPPNSRELATYLDNYSTVLRHTNRTTEAVKFEERAQAIRRLHR